MAYNSRVTKKEKGLIKGALRRVFSRSELRKNALAACLITGYADPNRPRVKKWAKCPDCQEMTPAYLMEVDHVEPFVPLGETFEQMSLDVAVDRLWSEESNLRAVCKPCHKTKSKAENKERRLIAKQGTKK